MNPVPYDSENPDDERQLAWQPGCTITLIPPDTVVKWGMKVQPSEETAMRIVNQQAPSIPIPKLYRASYQYRNARVIYGELVMSLVPGKSLKSAWAAFDDVTKARICQNIWDLITLIRKIVRPENLQGGLYCTADGSPSRDPLLGDNNDIAPCFLDDQTLRDRIYQRYVAHNGLSYRDSACLPDQLPRSDMAVFTHGDIGPRNIMVDHDGHILALLDWESSGWFPDYWEFAQMMKPCHHLEHDWQHWMARTKPQPWDITTISMARRVLF